MNCPPCTHKCYEGRDCQPRIDGLHTQPGGHSVHGGIAFPIEDGPQHEPEACRPVPSVAQVEEWPARVLAAALVLLAIAAALSPLPFL